MMGQRGKTGTPIQQRSVLSIHVLLNVAIPWSNNSNVYVNTGGVSKTSDVFRLEFDLYAAS